MGAVAALPGAGHGAAACTGSAPARAGAALVAGSKLVGKVGKDRKCGILLFSTDIMHGEQAIFSSKTTPSPTPTSQTMFELHQTGGLKLVDLS